MRTLHACILALALLAGCTASEQTRRDQVDAGLQTMLRKDERGLIAFMGRAPDSVYQFEDKSKLLSWRFDTSRISPGSAPVYYPQSGSLVPIGGEGPTLQRSECLIEWTVVDGRAQRYSMKGNGCGL